MPRVLVSSSTSMSSSRVAPCPIALRTCWRIPGSNRCVAAASIASSTSSLTLGSSGPLRHGTDEKLR